MESSDIVVYSLSRYYVSLYHIRASPPVSPNELVPFSLVPFSTMSMFQHFQNSTQIKEKTKIVFLLFKPIKYKIVVLLFFFWCVSSANVHELVNDFIILWWVLSWWSIHDLGLSSLWWASLLIECLVYYTKL